MLLAVWGGLLLAGPVARAVCMHRAQRTDAPLHLGLALVCLFLSPLSRPLRSPTSPLLKNSCQATTPDVEGELVLEAHMGCTAELPLWLYAPGPLPTPFTAELSPDTPLALDITPSSGLLPPAPPDDARGARGAGKSNADGTDGTAAPCASIVPPPLRVTFTCREMGRVVRGRLLVTTPDRQYTYLLLGRQPAYLPPSKAALPTGTYLHADTAASAARRAHGGNRHAGTLGRCGAGGGTLGDAVAVLPRHPRNHLQANIRAAAGAAVQNQHAAKTCGGTDASAAARPWA